MNERLNKSKVIEYILLKETVFSDLSDRVNEHLEEGWQPWGGPGIGVDEMENHYIQAMVRYE